MADDRRLNLDDSADQLTSNLLKDVQAAAEAVQKRRAAIKEEEKRAAAATKSKKQIGILVAVGAIIVFLISYWIVFARPDTAPQQSASGPTAVQTQESPKVKISTPVTVSPSTPTRAPAAGVQPPKDAQVVEHPSDEYEPPSGDTGM
ncbi:MAG: hypothetical protein QHI38_06680 [Armatimonadota bacterium]|nr:hypothetical protein [Armatimonadota bacterium]